MLAEESRGLALRQAVEAPSPSPLRSAVLGTMAYSSGQLGEAERHFSEALERARDDPGSRPPDRRGSLPREGELGSSPRDCGPGSADSGFIHTEPSS